MCRVKNIYFYTRDTMEEKSKRTSGRVKKPTIEQELRQLRSKAKDTRGSSRIKINKSD